MSSSKPLMLKEVRIALSNLDVAKPFKQTPPRFSATFQIDKDSPQAQLLEQTIQDVAEAEWPGKGKKKVEEFRNSKQQFCVQDGDDSDFEPAHGTWRLTAHRNEKHGRPEARTRKNTPAKPGEIYDGCYVNASVDIWAQSGENPGLRCGLVGVQFVKDGDAFGGARRGDENLFAPLDVEDDEDDI